MTNLYGFNVEHSLHSYLNFFFTSFIFKNPRCFKQHKKLLTLATICNIIQPCYIVGIRSNLRVAQNGRFLINPVYPGGGTVVANILDFRLSESLKMHSPGPFALPNYLGRKFNFAFSL